jgi:uracil phosphoribosyltransferase
VFQSFLGQIRNVTIHNDSMRFRRNIERIGEIMAYEMSKELHYKEINIQTHWVLRKQLKFQIN